MRDLLPANGASAVMIADPQERESEVLAYCACCGAPLRSGDGVVRSSDGAFFCDEECYLRWVIREGGADYVVLSEDGNHILKGVA